MILYIHGFGGSGEGVKATYFKTLTCNTPVVAPSLSYVPDLAIATLCELIETFRASSDEKLATLHLIGSSLGGYYAHYLSHRYGLKAVLLNPALYPYQRLASLKGEALNYYDGSYFQCNEAHFEMLKKYDVPATAENEKILLLCQKGDEVIDYREAVAKLGGAEIVVDEGGNHAFDDIAEHLARIETFLHVRFSQR